MRRGSGHVTRGGFPKGALEKRGEWGRGRWLVESGRDGEMAQGRESSSKTRRSGKRGTITATISKDSVRRGEIAYSEGEVRICIENTGIQKQI